MKKPMSPEQQEWYLAGYLQCFIRQIATELDISEETVKKWIINSLEYNAKCK